MNPFIDVYLIKFVNQKSSNSYKMASDVSTVLSLLFKRNYNKLM